MILAANSEGPNQIAQYDLGIRSPRMRRRHIFVWRGSYVRASLRNMW